MNWKKLWLAAPLVCLAFIATSFLFHGLILGDFYMKPEVQSAMRLEEEMNNLSSTRFLTRPSGIGSSWAWSNPS